MRTLDDTTEHRELQTLLCGLRRVRVLVIGDLMLDQYLYGSVDRISPEAPVGILDWVSLNSTLGGAANVAKNLADLGCEVLLVGLIGSEQEGEELLNLARKAGINTNGVISASERPTTVKTRIISHGHQVLRIDKEQRAPVQGHQLDRLLDYAERCTSQIDGVILSDYAKGVLVPRLCSQVTTFARARGIPVLVDPKGTDFSKYRGASVLTPNKKEVREATGMPVETETQLRESVARIFSIADCQAVLVTRSEEGMSLYAADGSESRINTKVRDVFDITGAGDTVISMLGRVLFADGDLLSAARLANIAAGVKIRKLGTVGVTPDEIIEWLRQKDGQNRGKVVELSQLKQLVSHAHSQNKTVVFTNGCFDLLHVGHVQLLQKAKALGHILIVAINDDHSVRILKGDGRPLIAAADRATILAALEFVDYVVILGEPTPSQLIKELHPDVLVKGGDYSLEEVVGAGEVKEYGGKVVLVPLIEHRSSSAMCEKIASRYGIADIPSN